MADSKRGRRGRLQRAILRHLRNGPADYEKVREVFADTRSDNFSRSVAVLAADGLITVGRHRAGQAGVLTLVTDSADCNEESDEAGVLVVTLPYAPGSMRWMRAYKALCRVFLILSEGVPVPASELFPPRTAPAAFGRYVLESMSAEGLIESRREGFWEVKDAKALKSAWAKERVFCALAGWTIPDAHADAMSTLQDGGALREEAAAALRLAEIMGQENVYRRTNITPRALGDLRAVALLPSGVQEVMELNNIGAAEARGLAGDDEDEMMAKLSGAYDSFEDFRVSLADNEPAADTDASVPLEDMVSACLKLCAGTAQIVSEMDRKLQWLARELGYKENP